jgi:hypothetical protein
MRVHIIPEGVRSDHFILKPFFSAMFDFLEKPHVRIGVHSPAETGWEAVKKASHIREIIGQFPTVHLFVLCVDRDGHDERRRILDDLETKTRKLLAPGQLFLAEQAWQEI